MESSIIHVSAHYPPHLGGLERVVQSLVAYRISRRMPVEVLTSKHCNEQSDEAYVHRLKSYEIAHTPIMPALPIRLLRLSNNSLVHLHVAQAFVPETVYLAHAIRRLPYIAHLHVDVGPSGPAGFLLHAYKPLVLARVLRGAQAVVVFTDDQARVVASKYGVLPGRIAVIPNGVDMAFSMEEPRSIHSRPRLLFVGRLSVQKNIEMFLHALEGISGEFDTTLVGDGDLEDGLKNLAQDLRLENVRFCGRVDGEDLVEHFRQADIFVLPSEREGMPLVLLEALAMGLPVVATDIVGTRDVITNRESGILVPLNDVDRLRLALVEIASDETQYFRMSRAARAAAEQYSWDNVGDEFERLYALVSRML